MKQLMLVTAAAMALFTAIPSFAKRQPVVGGQKMYANKDIIDNAVNSADRTTLVAAVKGAGLSPRAGNGPR